MNYQHRYMSHVDLAAMLKRKGKTRPIRLPVLQTSQVQADSLLRLHMRVVREWAVQARNRIMPSYEDRSVKDAPNTMESQIDAADQSVAKLILELTPDLFSWASGVERWHRGRFSAMTKVATGIDVADMVSEHDVRDLIHSVLLANASLITGVSDDIRRTISTVVYQGYANRTPVKAIASDVMDAVDVGKTRATLIARDQTTKLAGALDQERQQQFGIEQFIWRHSGKVHFRPIHKARDGELFAWDDPDLVGDLPGEAINCGCKAQAYIEL